MSEYPKTMTHPHARKGAVQELRGIDPNSGKPYVDYQGESDLFPPVNVNNPDQEADHRARGYLLEGEASAPPAEYAEYPVMLSHPEHVDAIADDWHVEKGEGGQVLRTRIPGSPEKYAPMQADDEEGERALEAKGYKRVGAPSPDAVRTAHASPYDPNRKRSEYPKMVNGRLVADPSGPKAGPVEYPKYIGDVLVTSAEHEAELTGTPAREPVEELHACVICGETLGEDDPTGEGPKGSYHLAHMAPLAAEPKSSESAAPARPGRRRSIKE